MRTCIPVRHPGSMMSHACGAGSYFANVIKTFNADSGKREYDSNLPLILLMVASCHTTQKHVASRPRKSPAEVLLLSCTNVAPRKMQMRARAALQYLTGCRF